MATVPRSGRRQDQRVGLEDGRGFKGSEAFQVLCDTPQHIKKKKKRSFCCINLE